jgi:stage II sporulation protein M
MINQIKKSYKELIKLIKQFKIILIIILFFFTVSIITGYTAPLESQQLIIDLIKTQFEDIINAPDFEMFLKVMTNNIIASFIIIILGITIVLPLAIIFFNGQILGIVAGHGVATGTLGPNPYAKLLLTILPHGIIELPAIFLSTFLAILLGLKLFFKHKILPKESIKQVFKKFFKIYFYIIIPAIILAAIVEIFVTKPLFT